MYLYFITTLSSQSPKRMRNLSLVSLRSLLFSCRAVTHSWGNYIELQEHITCPHGFLLRLCASAWPSIIISPFSSCWTTPSSYVAGESPHRLWAPLWIMGTVLLLPDHPGTWWPGQLSTALSWLDPPHSQSSLALLLLFVGSRLSLLPETSQGSGHFSGTLPGRWSVRPLFLEYTCFHHIFVFPSSLAWRNFF